MKRIKEICKIISIKTVLTVAVIATFCILAIRGDEMSTEFMVIATAVVTYYFCKETTIEDKVAEHEKNFH